MSLRAARRALLRSTTLTPESSSASAPLGLSVWMRGSSSVSFSDFATDTGSMNSGAVTCSARYAIDSGGRFVSATTSAAPLSTSRCDAK